MAKSWVFDAPHYQCITRARIEFLESFLPDLIKKAGISTALDVGCGLGDFSAYLESKDLITTSIDGRIENVLEAQRRHQNIAFRTYDIESSDVQELGLYDLVLCFGLLYHLENPIAAIRNLESLTSKVLLIESMIMPTGNLLSGLIEEPNSEDQGLRLLALVLSEPALVKVLYRAGFPFVYQCSKPPAHEHFLATRSQHRRRTVLIASKIPVVLPFWHLASEPKSMQPWEKQNILRIVRIPRRILGFARRNLRGR